MILIWRLFVNVPEEIQEAFRQYYEGSVMGEEVDAFFDQLTEAAVLYDALRRAAEANPADKFQLVFRETLESLFSERRDLNEESFTNHMSHPELQ
jgi:type I restriction enzyme R subunit